MELTLSWKHTLSQSGFEQCDFYLPHFINHKQKRVFLVLEAKEYQQVKEKAKKLLLEHAGCSFYWIFDASTLEIERNITESGIAIYRPANWSCDLSGSVLLDWGISHLFNLNHLSMSLKMLELKELLRKLGIEEALWPDMSKDRETLQTFVDKIKFVDFLEVVTINRPKRPLIIARGPPIPDIPISSLPVELTPTASTVDAVRQQARQQEKARNALKTLKHLHYLLGIPFDASSLSLPGAFGRLANFKREYQQSLETWEHLSLWYPGNTLPELLKQQRNDLVAKLERHAQEQEADRHQMTLESLQEEWKKVSTRLEMEEKAIHAPSYPTSKRPRCDACAENPRGQQKLDTFLGPGSSICSSAQTEATPTLAPPTTCGDAGNNTMDSSPTEQDIHVDIDLGIFEHLYEDFGAGERPCNLKRPPNGAGEQEAV